MSDCVPLLQTQDIDDEEDFLLVDVCSGSTQFVDNLEPSTRHQGNKSPSRLTQP